MVCVELSRGTAYGICLSQLALALGVVLYCPTVKVETYTVRVPHSNLTLAQQLLQGPDANGFLSVITWLMPLPFMVCSGLVALYSTTTMGLHEQGNMGYDYSNEVMDTMVMWDMIFWTYTALVHLLVFTLVSSPGDIFAVLLAATLATYFLKRACAPRHQQVNITQENMNILGYFAGWGVCFYGVPTSNTDRVTIVCLLLVLDYFLGVGHTWDRQATLETISNCRLFYICTCSGCMSLLYYVWGETSMRFHE